MLKAVECFKDCTDGPNHEKIPLLRYGLRRLCEAPGNKTCNALRDYLAKVEDRLNSLLGP